MTDAKKILEDAAHIVTGARQAEYGPPEDNFARIAEMWTAYKGTRFAPSDVAAMMALLKVARGSGAVWSPDSATDLCGYGAIWGVLKAKEESA